MKINLFSFDLFLVILFYFKIKKTYSALSFSYPIAITLVTNNILVIEKNGIYICDYNVTKILNATFNFTNEEDKIKSEEDLSKVVIKRRSKIILGLINYKIFIFNPKGELLYNSNNSNLISGDNPDYCSLNFIEEYSNLYYYIIGYFNKNNSLILIYYKYDKSNNNNIKIGQNISEKLKFNNQITVNFQNKGLSCEYLVDEYNYNRQTFICFFVIKLGGKDYLINQYYQISTESIQIHNSYSSDYANEENIKFIKSDANSNLKKVLICFVKINNETWCYKFDFQNFLHYKIEIINICRRKYMQWMLDISMRLKKYLLFALVTMGVYKLHFLEIT